MTKLLWVIAFILLFACFIRDVNSKPYNKNEISIIANKFYVEGIGDILTFNPPENPDIICFGHKDLKRQVNITCVKK